MIYLNFAVVLILKFLDCMDSQLLYAEKFGYQACRGKDKGVMEGGVEVQQLFFPLVQVVDKRPKGCR